MTERIAALEQRLDLAMGGGGTETQGGDKDEVA